MCGTMFFADTFQFLSIGFNAAFAVISTLSFNFEAISASLEVINVGRTNPRGPIATLILFSPILIFATSFRIFLAFNIVFFLKAWSVFPLVTLVLVITFALTKTGCNTFKESLASALMFFAPFQLGRETVPGITFSRISCHSLTNVGFLVASTLFWLNHYDMFEPGSPLELDSCTPEWMLDNFIAILGATCVGYSTLTELHFTWCHRFYKSRAHA